MPLRHLSERDRAEIKRSAAEAAKVVLAPVEIDRYLAPSANSPYPLEFAFFLLGDIRGKTVLDLGCGTGEKVIPLIKLGAHVVALDICEDMVALARQRLTSYGIDGTSAILQVGSAYDTELPNSSIDVVFCMAVLHHLDLEMAHREIYRILRPGGRLILREPIRFSRIANSLRVLFPAPPVDISDFEHPMTRDELATVTRGFTVLADRSFRLPFVPFLARSAVFEKQVWKLDHWLLQHFPKLEHFATGKVMSLQRTAPPAATCSFPNGCCTTSRSLHTKEHPQDDAPYPDSPDR